MTIEATDLEMVAQSLDTCIEEVHSSKYSRSIVALISLFLHRHLGKTCQNSLQMMLIVSTCIKYIHLSPPVVPFVHHIGDHWPNLQTPNGPHLSRHFL